MTVEFGRAAGVRRDGRWHPNVSQYSQPAVDDPSAAAWCAPPDQQRALRPYEFAPGNLAGVTGCVRDHGLAIVKGVLEPPEVAALRADVLALLDPNDDAPAAITRTLYAFVEHSPAAAELLRNQRFMEIHRAICGSDESSGLTLHRTGSAGVAPRTHYRG